MVAVAKAQGRPETESSVTPPSASPAQQVAPESPAVDFSELRLPSFKGVGARLGPGQPAATPVTPGPAVAPQPTGPIEKLERDPSNPLPDNVQVFASSLQFQLSFEEIGGSVPIPSHFLKKVDENLQSSSSLESAISSIEDGTTPVGLPQNAVSSKLKSGDRFTVTDVVQPNRTALIISGGGAAPGEAEAFQKDGERMQEIASAKLGIPKENILTLNASNPEQVREALRTLSERGDQLLVYYSGHLVVDNQALSANPAGRVADDDFNANLAEIPGVVRGTQGTPEGSDLGAMVMSFNDTDRFSTLLHENKFKDMLREVSDSFDNGITLVIDACHSGTLIASNSPKPPERTQGLG